MKKLLFFISLFYVIFACSISASNVSAEKHFIFGERHVQTMEADVKVTGILPSVSVSYQNLSTTTTDLVRTISEKIEQLRAEKINAAKNAKASAVEFSYEIKEDGDYIFILIQTETTSTRPIIELNTINISTNPYKLIGINDYLGVNGVRILNEFISNEIKKDPKAYTSRFQEISDNHDFYVENNIFHIVFDGYEIIPGSKDIFTFQLPLTKISSFSLDAAQSRTLRNYNLRMVPIRPVCEAFGYSLRWDENGYIIIQKGSWYTSISIGKNEYYKGRDSQTRTEVKVNLEAAPMLQNDTTYLPISFFEEILGLYYTVDSRGNITFTALLD